MASHLEFGDPNGFPILYCHGTPGSAAECAFADAAARKHQLRLIAPDRPGYGQTPPAPDMNYSAWGFSAAQCLHELGMPRFGVLGISGGAPNALAVAVAAPERIAALSLVSVLGPLNERVLIQSANLIVRIMRAGAAHNLDALDHWVLSPLAAIGRRWPFAAQTFMRLHHSRPDRRVLTRPEIQALLALSLDRAFGQGSVGVKRDFSLMVKPWDFSLEKVTLDATLWQGLDDSLLSAAHSRWLAQCLPHATLKLIADEGHFSLPFDHAEQILGELAARCRV